MYMLGFGFWVLGFFGGAVGVILSFLFSFLCLFFATSFLFLGLVYILKFFYLSYFPFLLSLDLIYFMIVSSFLSFFLFLPRRRVDSNWSIGSDWIYIWEKRSSKEQLDKKRMDIKRKRKKKKRKRKKDIDSVCLFVPFWLDVYQVHACLSFSFFLSTDFVYVGSTTLHTYLPTGSVLVFCSVFCLLSTCQVGFLILSDDCYYWVVFLFLLLSFWLSAPANSTQHVPSFFSVLIKSEVLTCMYLMCVTN